MVRIKENIELSLSKSKCHLHANNRGAVLTDSFKVDEAHVKIRLFALLFKLKLELKLFKA